MNDLHIKRAKEYGVSFVISTDTPVTSQYDFMTYGVSVTRRGWVEKKDVLNTLGYEQFIARLKACKAAEKGGNDQVRF